jgi:hypothetical protein
MYTDIYREIGIDIYTFEYIHTYMYIYIFIVPLDMEEGGSPTDRLSGKDKKSVL